MHETKLVGPWTAIQIEVSFDQEELVSWLMIDYGARGCAIDPLEQGKICVRASFETGALGETTVCELSARLEEYGLAECLWTLKVEPFDNEDWFANWKQYFEPFPVGKKFLICPPWRADELSCEEGRLTIIIDPGMAFGTGLHATTKYCLTAIEKFDRQANIVDIGTGSGILAIASAMILANAAISAVDFNAAAIENARHNIDINKLADRIKLVEGEAREVLIGEFDVILSNITCADIIALLPVYIKHLAPAGKIICAGILNQNFASLEDALQDLPLKQIDKENDGEWVGITLLRT